jgi:NADPH:quinone reductase-like Zn-dependent oxidoreductase
MRAIVITTPGGPEVLRLKEVPDPVPGPGEALVEVTAAGIVAGVRADIWPLISSGRVSPVIERMLPMADAADAHRLLDDGTHVGKILLVN